MQRKRSIALAPITACALAASLIGSAPAALASHGQITFFDATNQLLNPSSRASTFSQLKGLGVSALRVMLYWHDVAPQANGAAKPVFEATNPASYDWGAYVPVLEEAKRLHWPVLLTVTSPVPKWASGNHRDFLTRPNDRDFQEFMTAAGREFGSEVSFWGIWNEPNQLGWLQPQFNRNGTPASPAIYRGLYLAAYAGLRGSGIGAPRVLMGETAPFGESRVNARRFGINHQVSPLAFLRGLLCLNAHYGRVGHCAQLPATGYAHHAYPNRSGPAYVPPNPDQVTIGTLGRLTRALDLAARAHAIGAHMPVYLTEYGINTRPNPLGVSPAQQAVFDAVSEEIAWANPRVASFGQYELRDDVIPRHHGPNWTGFQTGLETASGQAKPLAAGFPVSLVVRPVKHGYSLWGHVRPASGPTTLQVLVQAGRGRRYKVLQTVRTDGSGYWHVSSSVAGSSWRVRWVSPTHAIYEGPPIPAT
ncbi:MAG: hypothetical protein KGJ43_03590 [Acidobacteriota bacterium]|nr:hypothetical protein [Acidobacteriota bacterium]